METHAQQETDVKIGEVLLRLDGVKKSFPGVVALKGVDFELLKGEVHALVGENGAGKSTLMKILMGVYTRDEGTMVLNGKEVEIGAPEDAYEHGIGMIFQELSLVPQLTVGQNIYLNNESRSKLGFISDREIHERARNLMEKFHVHGYFDVKDRVEKLSRGYNQIVEVLKALSRDAKILIMDEPTASLTKDEEESLNQIIGNLKVRGVSIIYISHRLEEIFNNCDRVTVFRDGNKVTTSAVGDVTMNELIELMTGRTFDLQAHSHGSKSRDVEEALLRVENLSWKHRLRNVSFEVKKGEVLGITGLMGSGKSEIARALFGVEPPDSGNIYIDGKKVEIKHTWDAIGAGMALVPEDRRSQGLVLMHSVVDNIALPQVSDLKGFMGWFKKRQALRKSEEQVSSLAIKTPSLRQKTKFLSGGNQQKVVVGKWLTKTPRILILDEPTVGVDVKTKAELRSIIQGLVGEAERSVILFSSELNEILQLSDRIIILYRGEIIKEYSNEVPIPEDVLHRAVQGIT
jgi:ribose transport system ATP-binding protein